jgi:hypothetical protein
MKKVGLIASVVVALACGAGPQKPALNVAVLTNGVWVKLDSAWQPSPRESGFASVAYARVLRFAPDGRFSWIACVLLRNDARVTISPGDGQVFFFGRWEAADDHATVEYVKAREMIHVPGSDQPFAIKKIAEAEVVGDTLTFEGLRFTKSFAPNQRAYEEMVNGVRTWEATNLRRFFPAE